MVHSILTGAVYGVSSYPVTVEVDMAEGLPCIEMVGSLGSEVRESGERVRVALKNIGCVMPPKRFTVNLSPADMRKGGTAFDLPIAMAILECMDKIILPKCGRILAVGELGLDGSVRGVKGILPMLLMAKEQGVQTCFIPKANQKEGGCIQGMKVVGVGQIQEVTDYLRHSAGGAASKQYIFEQCASEREKIEEVEEMQEVEETAEESGRIPDFADIIGQSAAKRAAEIAAAGFHNLLLSGPPGTGKSMLAAAMPGILPPMTQEEMLDTSKVYSVAGRLNEQQYFIRKRPFISPHHTITPQALVGGGMIPRPGMISLANHGVLFLDELPEMKRQTLDLLRQPIEEGKITITRRNGSATYPCDFMLVAAMNPCPCGFFPDLNRCNCSEREVHRYIHSISGPILDRIDLCVSVMRNGYEQISRMEKGESSRTIRERVIAARKMQQMRNGKNLFNSRIPAADIPALCTLTKEAERTLEKYYAAQDLSMRGYHRLLKVARTIADLEGSEKLETKHVLEAASYRGMLA